MPHEERFLKILDKKKSVQDRIDALYAFLRDFGQVAKNADTREALKARAQALLEGSLSTGEKLQALFLQEDMGVDAAKQEAQKIATDAAAVPLQLIDAIPLAAYKKKALLLFRQNRADWDDIFLTCLMTNPHPTLRDLLCKELRHSDSADKFVQALESLLLAPQTNPEFFVWYFQKIVHEEGWPFSDKRGRCRFFESFLTLLPQIEQIGHYRDLVKRMHALISGHRFAIVRAIIDGTSVEYLKEILLLVSKSRSLGDHEVKILHSLAEVVQPSLAKEGKGRSAAAEQEVVWTTAEGYQKIQQRIQQIGTVETVENAREIEAARALGDLRENSEYKFALERRARLQGELKMLSSQINRARLITADDIPLEEVGIGTVVLVRNSKNQEFTYTLLGPWDADPDQNILSFQSKFAQAMAGRKAGETFGFQDENYTVVSVRSYLDK